VVSPMQSSMPKLMLYEVSDIPSADMNGITDVVGQSLVSLGQRNFFAQATFAAAIIIIYNNMIQKLAIDLGINAPTGVRALLIDERNNLHLTTILHAASNNVRHADEWQRFAATYASAHTNKERKKKQQQDASMVPLAKFLKLSLPITSDVSLRVLQALAQPSNLYAELELKLLKAGLELVRPTFPRARIGATIVQTAASPKLPGFACGNGAE
jgi:hypothetical protein